MSKVSMSVKEIWDLGLWDNVCEYKDWNPWIRNEGQISDDEIVEFDSKFEKEDEVIEIDYEKEYLRKDIAYKIIQKISFEYNFEQYEKYLVAYRNIETKEIRFEIQDVDNIQWILKLKEY